MNRLYTVKVMVPMTVQIPASTPEGARSMAWRHVMFDRRKDINETGLIPVIHSIKQEK